MGEVKKIEDAVKDDAKVVEAAAAPGLKNAVADADAAVGEVEVSARDALEALREEAKRQWPAQPAELRRPVQAHEVVDSDYGRPGLPKGHEVIAEAAKDLDKDGD